MSRNSFMKSWAKQLVLPQHCMFFLPALQWSCVSCGNLKEKNLFIIIILGMKRNAMDCRVQPPSIQGGTQPNRALAKDENSFWEKSVLFFCSNISVHKPLLLPRYLAGFLRSCIIISQKKSQTAQDDYSSRKEWHPSCTGFIWKGQKKTSQWSGLSVSVCAPKNFSGDYQHFLKSHHHHKRCNIKKNILSS